MLRTGLSVEPMLRTRSIRCGFPGGFRRFSRPLSSYPKLWTQEKRSIEDVLLPIVMSCPCDTASGFFLGGVFLPRCHKSLYATRLFSSVVTRPHHPCSVASVASDSLASADNFGDLARGSHCTNVHLARLMAGVQKAGIDIRDTSLASGGIDVSGYEVSPADACCTGTGKRISRILSRSDCLLSSSHWCSGNGASH